MGLIRLDKFLSGQMPQVSRSDAARLCKKGEIKVNGVKALSPALKIDPAADSVEWGDRKILYKKHLYIMLNKPAGVVCATRDGISKTVMELLPQHLRRQGLFPAGRLDKDTEGFVLITDDGELAHRMLSPKSHVPKTYFVRLEKELENDVKDAFLGGVTLEDGTVCKPAKLETYDKKNECTVVLTQGMYHQIKRMFEAVGNRVVYLKRIKIGGVWLDKSLPEGGVRELGNDEIQSLILT